jgi:signal transduction histidine kinase
MATQVAHELKNPLGGLKLYARTLEQRLGGLGDAEGVELARKINGAIDHLAELVTEITAFGRPAELRRAPTSINALLDECLALAEDRVAGRRIEVVRAYDSECPAAMVDARELKKVFLNLIVNGLDAMGQEGTLSVRTAYRPEAVAILVSVEDTGVGMTGETRSRIFDLFFTTKPNGTGLGMAIAQSVVNLHGGNIQVESAPGRGTMVHVHLPAEASA